jgi:hypothetical protein
MNLEKLKFVKNIDDPERWAYADWPQGSEQDLHWPNSKGSKASADKADMGDLILLVQKPPHIPETLATHLVEVITTSAEEINDGEWGIIRQVKVLWAADPNNKSFAPKDKDIFGWKRHRAEGPRVILLTNVKEGRILQLWHSTEIFQRHIASMLGLTED